MRKCVASVITCNKCESLVNMSVWFDSERPTLTWLIIKKFRLRFQLSYSIVQYNIVIIQYVYNIVQVTPDFNTNLIFYNTLSIQNDCQHITWLRANEHKLCWEMIEEGDAKEEGMKDK